MYTTCFPVKSVFTERGEKYADLMRFFKLEYEGLWENSSQRVDYNIFTSFDQDTLGEMSYVSSFPNNFFLLTSMNKRTTLHTPSLLHILVTKDPNAIFTFFLPVSYQSSLNLFRQSSVSTEEP